MTSCPKCGHVFTAKKGNKKYQKGACYERIVKHKLETKGYTVHRAYASRGTYDLIAVKDSLILGIQVKNLNNTNKSYLTPKDRKSLNDELTHTKPYILYHWDQKLRAVVTKNFERPIQIIHAWKENSDTKYAKLTDINKWQSFKP